MYLSLIFYVAVMNLKIVYMQISYNTQGVPAVRFSTTVPKTVKVKMCYLKPDIGPCRGDIETYYFNPTEMTCSTFLWGGCQGNGNRFETKQECYDTCVTKYNEPKKRPRYCELTFDYGFCFGAVERWYFDRLWKVCKKRIYSGCGGNKNNFYSFEQCDQICRLNKLPMPTKKRARDDGKGHTVLYIYTNGTTRSRNTARTTTVLTKSRPRWMYTSTTDFAPGVNTTRPSNVRIV